MARFKNLLKYKLKNSQHFDFVEAFRQPGNWR